MEALGRPGAVVVVDNNSSDRTAELAADLGAEVVFEPVNQIARARNAGGFATADATDYLIFLDADTLLSAELLGKALALLDSGEVSGGGGHLDLPGENVPGGAPRLWNAISRRFRVACGCFIFCRREAFIEVGGFSQRVYAGEEVFFSRAVRRWGKRRGMRFVIIPDPPIVSSSRKFEWFGSAGMLLQLVLLLCFPVLACSRRFCAIWYRRPTSAS